MKRIRPSPFGPPVDQLLTYGEAQSVSPEDWPNYLALGLGQDQIPDLIRMATDEDLNWADSDSLEVWAPLHAWRALGQLRAEAAVEPLLSLFDALPESDWVLEELPEVLGLIGASALPALAAYLADDAHDDEARISVIPSVEKIGTRWPEARRACVQLLSEQLEQFDENDQEVNGFLVAGLVELQATEAAPLIERAFAARQVARIVMGDWEDVQVALGLLSPEALEQRRKQRRPGAPPSTPGHQMTPQPVSPRDTRHHEAAHRKTKSKMSRASRKKNRR